MLLKRTSKLVQSQLLSSPINPALQRYDTEATTPKIALAGAILHITATYLGTMYNLAKNVVEFYQVIFHPPIGVTRVIRSGRRKFLVLR